MLLGGRAGPAESAFSSTGEVVTKKRTRISDETLEMMTITRHHLRQPTFVLDDMVKNIMAEAKAALAAEKDESSSGSGDEGMDVEPECE